MTWEQIQPLIDQGKGFAAAELGQPHNVYRLNNPDQNGNVIIPANLIKSGVLAFYKIAYGAAVRTSFEGDRQQGILWYEIIADLSTYKVNDVFINADTVYPPGVPYANGQIKGFSKADAAPIKKVFGGHLNNFATFYRMNNQETDSDGRFGSTTKDGLPFVLVDGVVTVGAVGDTPTKFPCSLISEGRSYGDRNVSNVPGDERRSGTALYVPAFEGMDIRDSDRVICASDGSTYTVVVPYVQLTGATGWQCFLERDTSGAG